jgi:hypothetical protein
LKGYIPPDQIGFVHGIAFDKNLLLDQLNILKWNSNVKIKKPSKKPSLITDSNQACLPKKAGRRFQEGVLKERACQ